MIDMKSIPALSFKRTCALNVTSNESALIHFVSSKLCSHENLMPVWHFMSVKMTYLKSIPFWVSFHLNSCQHKKRAGWTLKWEFQPKWNLIPVWVHFGSHVNVLLLLTLFRMGGGGKKDLPPTGFSSVTSANVGISPQNFLTFNFNHFATLV